LIAMRNNFVRNILTVSTLLVTTLATTQASAALAVFACEPEWASLTQELGGKDVSVYQATNAMQDPHRIEARPSLVARMRGADLVICTGAELEIGWLPVLLQTAGNRKVQPGTPGFLAAADYVTRLDVPTSVDRAGGDIHPGGNPHIQLDPRNITRVAAALSERLSSLDPDHKSAYAARATDFQERWSAAINRWEATAAPLKGMRLVPYHKDAAYLTAWLGMVEVMDIEPKPGSPPSAGYLAQLVERVQRDGADAITRSAYNDPKAPEWLAQHTGVPLVELPFTVGGTPQAKNLFGLFDDTIARLLQARTEHGGN
jgi:zinc/manganese transport system substrate-binding protein